MYHFLGVVNSAPSSIVGNFLVDFLETLVILSAILLPTQSPVASTVFCIDLLEAVFIAYFPYLLLTLLAKDMNPHLLVQLNISFLKYLFNYHC